MLRTRTSRQKALQSSKSSKLSNITEEEEEEELEAPHNATNMCLEKFELEFAFRLKKYDELLEEKLAVLNRIKERLKIKYATFLASALEENNVMEFKHDMENVSRICGVEGCSSHGTCAETKNVNSSLEGPLGKQVTHSCKQKNKEETLVPYSAGGFQTPAISTVIPSLPTITPKIAMNTPVSMLRLPRQGEMALSLSGTPLKITAMSHESKPNMNIPLNSQQVLSLVPDEHLDPNCLPELEEQVVEQLEALDKNLQTFINLTSSNAA